MTRVVSSLVRMVSDAIRQKFPSRGEIRAGAERSAWRNDVTWNWPKDTLVLPVQAARPARCEAGDVVTIMPRQIINAGVRTPPFQALVRYAARDGYPASNAASGDGFQWDTINERLAFAHQLPDPALLPDPVDAPQTMLIGRGWNGDDLSMAGNQPTRRGQMPQRSALTDTADARGARLYLGCPAPQSPCAAVEVIIDDLCAGPLAGPSDANGQASVGVDPVNPGDDTVGGCEIVEINGSRSGLIDDTPTSLPLRVTASTSGPNGVFKPLNSNFAYGLCLIDGEAFAYRYIDERNALLISRGLLGTAIVKHRLAPSSAVVANVTGATPNREVWPTLPVVRLPLGPVGELATQIGPATQGGDLDVIEIPFSSYFRDPSASGFDNAYKGTYAAIGDQHLDEAPCVVISDPLAAQEPEVLRLLEHPTQANQKVVAPWLRGLYGTSVQTWTPGFNNDTEVPPAPATRPSFWENQDVPGGTPFVPVLAPQPAGHLNPMVIAWWPRFAPGLPQTLPANAAAVLRSRSFAWAGFPLRLNGARFDPNIQALRPMPAGAGLADVRIAEMSDCDIEVRALAAGNGSAELFDWDASPVELLSVLGSNAITAQPFSGWASPRFVGREVDGAEMRVHWTRRRWRELAP